MKCHFKKPLLSIIICLCAVAFVSNLGFAQDKKRKPKLDNMPSFFSDSDDKPAKDTTSADESKDIPPGNGNIKALLVNPKSPKSQVNEPNPAVPAQTDHLFVIKERTEEDNATLYVPKYLETVHVYNGSNITLFNTNEKVKAISAKRGGICHDICKGHDTVEEFEELKLSDALEYVANNIISKFKSTESTHMDIYLAPNKNFFWGNDPRIYSPTYEIYFGKINGDSMDVTYSISIRKTGEVYRRVEGNRYLYLDRVL